jgi:hypothetical protein
MSVTVLHNFIVMAYQSPAAPIILVRAGYLYFSLPLFAAAHCNSSRHWRGEGIVNLFILNTAVCLILKISSNFLSYFYVLVNKGHPVGLL